MYSYTWDPETGGLLLNSSPLLFSKEPRPVYYQEMDILGFNRFWNYSKDDSAPYMWAEANNYYYRGRLIATTKGGSLNCKPEIDFIETPEPGNNNLEFVNIHRMTEKNRLFIETLSQHTIKMIYNTFVEYNNKVDVFYVAFSGGKDSIVTLDLVQKALPHNSFKVLFGDTGMEFPDTYQTVDHIENYCNQANIEFIRSKSDFTPKYTWSKFGPPSTVNRWCCSVHKTAPQILALRESTGITDFTGLAFIGVRASESIARSDYDYISLGEKHKGQYSCNPILEWNSAELFLYIYNSNLYINKAYKKGNRRAGCLVCPRAAERNDYISRYWYTQEFDALLDSIKTLYASNFSSEERLNEFIRNGGWKARKNGRDISINLNYSETEEGGNQRITISNPRSNWKEWIKTIGILQNSASPYHIIFRQQLYEFELIETDNTITVRFDSIYAKQNPLFVKLFKNVFRKVAVCINCRECEADCHNGCIHMKGGDFYIDENCVHCSQCHKVEKGCLVYKSLEKPTGGLKMSTTKSLNCYSHHAPKYDWLIQFFNYKEDFDEKHSLGSQMYVFFKRFLRDAGLLNGNEYSDFARLIGSIGLDELSAWALMLVNLSYSPEINWLVKRVPFYESYNKDYVLSLLVDDGAKESWVSDIWSAYARILELPFSKVGLGLSEKEGGKMISIRRMPWQEPDHKVVLYALYKFAESCGNYYQFTLSRLLDDAIDSDGNSPTILFGLDNDTMTSILKGLSINYPEYISASFTHDLDNITLREDKTSEDILKLF